MRTDTQKEPMNASASLLNETQRSIEEREQVQCSCTVEAVSSLYRAIRLEHVPGDGITSGGACWSRANNDWSGRRSLLHGEPPRRTPRREQAERVPDRRHRCLGGRARRLQEVLQRHARRQRRGLRADPAPRPDAREPHRRVGRHVHTDARGAGRRTGCGSRRTVSTSFHPTRI